MCSYTLNAIFKPYKCLASYSHHGHNILSLNPSRTPATHTHHMVQRYHFVLADLCWEHYWTMRCWLHKHTPLCSLQCLKLSRYPKAIIFVIEQQLSWKGMMNNWLKNLAKLKSTPSSFKSFLFTHLVLVGIQKMHTCTVGGSKLINAMPTICCHSKESGLVFQPSET